MSGELGCERKQLKVTTAINVKKKKARKRKKAFANTHTIYSGSG